LINNCNAIYRQRARIISDESVPEAGVQEAGYANAEWETFINCLEEKYRIIIMLYYVEGFKTREIAEILQINENTVRGRLATARKKLKAQYTNEGNIKNTAGYGGSGGGMDEIHRYTFQTSG